MFLVLKRKATMKTSVSNLTLSAIFVALVCASTAAAGGHKFGGGGGGKSGGSGPSMSFKSLGSSRVKLGNSSSNSFSFKKFNSNHVVSGNNGINVSKLNSRLSPRLNKNIGLGQTLKPSKGPITLNHNINVLKSNKIINNTLNKSFNNFVGSKFDNKSKGLFCKKDNFWFDWWFSKSYCHPHLGCYYPWYGYYNYVTPYYATCDYTITVLPNVVPARTLVAVGSVLMINGEAFGDTAGGARLRIGGIAMPIEVLEWTPTGVKVRLPMVEITGAAPAEIEVYRGDGSLAAKAPIQLTAVTEQVVVGG
jgi:hypothetical protein